MNVLLGICAAIVTVAFVALTVATVRALNRFRDVAAQLEQTSRRLDESIAGVQAVTREAQGLISSAGQAVPHIQRAARSIETVGTRAAGLGHALLNEVEIPLRTAIRLFRGARYTAGSLLEKLARREHARMNNGGYYDE
jgi:uncharacterized protein YoxC